MKTEQVYVQCKTCGATETLELINGEVKTPRWVKIKDEISHKCHAEEPNTPSEIKRRKQSRYTIFGL